MEQITHSKPWITSRDVEAVANVLATSMLAQGALTRELEIRLAAWVDKSDAVAAGSGSAALVLALEGLKIGQGAEVILPTYVCPSVLEAVLAVGATPVLADVGECWVMTLADAKRVATERTAAIIVPHMYGIFADIASFRTLGVPIIEDCAQALGAEGGRKSEADVLVLSFHPTKCLTSGEGGMAISSDSTVLERMRARRDGLDSGYAARYFSPLSDLAAGLAMSQLDRYADALSRRREIAAHYVAVIEESRPSALNMKAVGHSMFFRFPLHIEGGLDACKSAFLDLGIHVRKGVDQLLHRGSGLPDLLFPSAVRHFDRTVSIPIYPALSAGQEQRCAEALARVLGQGERKWSNA